MKDDIRVELIGGIKKAAQKAGLAPSTWCALRMRDGKLISRLEAGHDIMLGTLDRLNDAIASEPTQ